MHNVLECNNDFSMAGNLRIYYRDEGNDDANENNATSTFWVTNEKIITIN